MTTPERPHLDERVARLFDDQEPRAFGSGWISGTASVFLGVLAVGGVACLRFPELLTWPGVREVYALWWIRPLVATVIGGAFMLGLLSALLRRRKVLGLTGMGLALMASLAGGATVPVEAAPNTTFGLGLDWFLLNLLLVALVFVPMERLFPQWPAQSTFRSGWTTDVMHFFVSHLLVQASAWLTLAPAAAATRLLLWPDVQSTVAALPWIVQLGAIILVADLGEYTMHRAFHRVPWLWRFHAIHHSSEQIDWLAGSRLHLVDVVLTRGFTFVPIALLGFANGPVYAYLGFVSFHAVFIHANVRFRFGAAEHWIVTPASTIGITARSGRRGTKTSPSTCRGSTNSSAPTTSPRTDGRPNTDSATERSPTATSRTFSGRFASLLSAGGQLCFCLLQRPVAPNVIDHSQCVPRTCAGRSR